MTKDGELYFSQLLGVAQTLFEPNERGEYTEYACGVCELLGRVKLDLLGIGEGTGENAMEIAEHLDVHRKPRP